MVRWCGGRQLLRSIKVRVCVLVTIPKNIRLSFLRNNQPLAEGITENRLTGGASAAVKNTVAPNEVNGWPVAILPVMLLP